MSEGVGDADDDADAELGEQIEEKIAYRQHVKGSIIGEHQVLFERDEVGDAHDDQCNEYQCKSTLRTEQYGEEDQDVSEAHIDGRHRDGVKGTQIGKLSVSESRCYAETHRQKKNAEPENHGDRSESDERMRGEKIRLTEQQRDQHPKKRRVCPVCKEYHQRSKCCEDTVDDEDLRDRYFLRTVLDRAYRMPDIVHDRAQHLRDRWEFRTHLIDESGKRKLAVGCACAGRGGPGVIPDLLRLFRCLFAVVRRICATGRIVRRSRSMSGGIGRCAGGRSGRSGCTVSGRRRAAARTSLPRFEFFSTIKTGFCHMTVCRPFQIKIF